MDVAVGGTLDHGHRQPVGRSVSATNRRYITWMLLYVDASPVGQGLADDLGG